jgi:predicted dehydrogenase
MAQSHAAALRELDGDFELHVADPSASAREVFARRFPHATLHDSAEEMLAGDAVTAGDLAIVATPPWLHREYVERAARAGCHVLCEKPLLLSAEEIAPVMAVLRETGRELVCCSTRFIENPATLQVRERVAKGELGKIYAVKWRHLFQKERPGLEYQPESPFFLDRSRNGGGCLTDYGAYELAILDAILEPESITIAQAMVAQPEVPAELPEGVVFDVETHAMSTLIFHRADGSRVPVFYERSAAAFEPDQEDVRVLGTRGSATWDWLGVGERIELNLRDVANEDGVTESFAPPRPNYVFSAPLRETLALLDGKPSRAIRGEQALFQIATMRGIYAVAESGEPVTIRRSDYRLS